MRACRTYAAVSNEPRTHAVWRPFGTESNVQVTTSTRTVMQHQPQNQKKMDCVSHTTQTSTCAATAAGSLACTASRARASPPSNRAAPPAASDTFEASLVCHRRRYEPHWRIRGHSFARGRHPAIKQAHVMDGRQIADSAMSATPNLEEAPANSSSRSSHWPRRHAA